MIIGWHKSILSSDWSDTMLDIAVTFFYHPIYMIIDVDRAESDGCSNSLLSQYSNSGKLWCHDLYQLNQHLHSTQLEEILWTQQIVKIGLLTENTRGGHAHVSDMFFGSRREWEILYLQSFVKPYFSINSTTTLKKNSTWIPSNIVNESLQMLQSLTETIIF